MAEFLTTSGTSYHIENIIMSAKNEIFLVSPYLQLSKTLYERLKDACNRGVKIKLVYGKDELKPNEKSSLAGLRSIDLYYFDNLHAKCYFNENQMVITSMNMYEFSEKTNREMGILISKTSDTDLYERAKAETLSILQSADEIISNTTEKKLSVYERNSDKRNSSIRMGYCIRCEVRIPLDSNRPYCNACYGIWSQFQNPQYEENVCHSCGEFVESTIEKPLCYRCFKYSSY